jgi:hypothetical protein
MIGPTSIREEMDKVSSLIGTAARLLDQGAMVDLAALEPKVRQICEAVACLDQDEGRPLRPGLEALIADLDRLAELIERHHSGGPADPAPLEVS